MAKYRVDVWDNTEREPAAVSVVPVADDITAGNMDIITTAIDALTIGTVGAQKLQTSVLNDPGSEVRPASQLAQREKRWRVAYTDNVTNKKYSFSIGAADLTLLASGAESLDLSAGAGLTFVSNVEGLLESELGNACTITSISFVTT